jgi:1-deoxy-D-xylulose-5-phosphate reductoisomerase
MSQIARECEADVAVIATVGAAGFKPTFEAIQAGKNIALANKEVLAMAGDLLMQNVKKHNVSVVPIDSEHSAIQQCIQCGRHEEIDRIVLTASGGPFHGLTPEEFENMPVEKALKHPTWNMGAKITIDSATLFNKGLEVIEAHHLFDMPLSKIDVVIHPQSIIHSMVEFIDGSVMAQLGDADMRTPIQYALSYPERIQRSGRTLDLLEVSQLTFFKPDTISFPCLELLYEAARIGETMPAFVSIANEEIVEAYLERKINFGSIPRLLAAAMQRHSVIKEYTLESMDQVDAEARRIARELIQSGKAI